MSQGESATGEKHVESWVFCGTLMLDNLAPDGVENERSPLWSGNAAAAEEQKGKLVKAALYGIQVFYSFFIM